MRAEEVRWALLQGEMACPDCLLTKKTSPKWLWKGAIDLSTMSNWSTHLEWWRAYSHFVRPHASLRMTLVQPRERGGKLLAQRYRQRTEAMAAGKTNRRWTAREVLLCPLPPLSA